MFQPIIEKRIHLQIGQEIQIDNMRFYIRRVRAHWKVESDFSLSLWGSRPNATTLHHSRIIKYKDHIWRPEKNGLDFETFEGAFFIGAAFDQVELNRFMENQYNSGDEVISCDVSLTTMVNSARDYDFDREAT